MDIRPVFGWLLMIVAILAFAACGGPSHDSPDDESSLPPTTTTTEYGESTAIQRNKHSLISRYAATIESLGVVTDITLDDVRQELYVLQNSAVVNGELDQTLPSGTLWVISLNAEHTRTPIDVCTSPEAMALDTVDALIYVACSSGPLEIIDVDSKGRVDLIAFPDMNSDVTTPTSIVLDETNAQVIVAGSELPITAISTVTHNVIHTRMSGFNIESLAINYSDSTLYAAVGNYEGNCDLLVLDLQSLATLDEISIESSEVFSIVLDESTSTAVTAGDMYTTDTTVGMVEFVDTEKRQRNAGVTLPGTVVGNVEHIAIDSLNGIVYALTLHGSELTSLDLNSHLIIETRYLRGIPGPLVLDAEAETLFVANHTVGSVDILTAMRGERLTSKDVTIAEGTEPVAASAALNSLITLDELPDVTFDDESSSSPNVLNHPDIPDSNSAECSTRVGKLLGPRESGAKLGAEVVYRTAFFYENPEWFICLSQYTIVYEDVTAAQAAVRHHHSSVEERSGEDAVLNFEQDQISGFVIGESIILRSDSIVTYVNTENWTGDSWWDELIADLCVHLETANTELNATANRERPSGPYDG